MIWFDCWEILWKGFGFFFGCWLIFYVKRCVGGGVVVRSGALFSGALESAVIRRVSRGSGLRRGFGRRFYRSFFVRRVSWRRSFRRIWEVAIRVIFVRSEFTWWRGWASRVSFFIGVVFSASIASLRCVCRFTFTTSRSVSRRSVSRSVRRLFFWRFFKILF